VPSDRCSFNVTRVAQQQWRDSSVLKPSAKRQLNWSNAIGSPKENLPSNVSSVGARNTPALQYLSPINSPLWATFAADTCSPNPSKQPSPLPPARCLAFEKKHHCNRELLYQK